MSESFYMDNDNSETIEAGDQDSKYVHEAPDDSTEKEEGELEEGEVEDEDLNIEESADVSQTALTKENNDSQNKSLDPNDNNESKKRKHNSQSNERNAKRHHGRDRRPRRSKGRDRHRDRDDHTNKKMETDIDFDQMLKQELYLRGEVSTPEVFNDVVQESGGDSDNVERDDRRGSKGKRKSKSPSKKSASLCMFFLQGQCQKGNSCCYSHDVTQPRKMELCKFYLTDRCAKRDKCLYMHKDFPCKFYHFGMKCLDGKECKFSHDTLQEPAKHILLKHIELAPKDILGNFPRLPRHSAFLILEITFNKRHGKPINEENLQSVADMKGKGFKYIDKALKSMGKCEPTNESSKEKSVDRKSPSMSNSKINDGEDSKDDRNRNRDRRRDHRKHRSRGDKERHHHRSKNSDLRREKYSCDASQENEEMNKVHENYGEQTEYPFNVSHGHRELFDRIQSKNQFYHQNFQMDSQMMHNEPQPTHWYSSDEEHDQISSQMSNHSENQFDRQMNSNQNQPIEVYEGTKLNIDVNYFQNLLSQVRNATNNTKDVEEKVNDISEDIKDVFNIEDKESDVDNRTSKNTYSLTLDLQNLIKTTREKCAASNMPSEDYKSNIRSRNSHNDSYENPQRRNSESDSRTYEKSLSDTPAFRDPRRNRLPNSVVENAPVVPIAKQLSKQTFSSDINSISLSHVNNSIYNLDIKEFNTSCTTEEDSIFPFKLPIHTPAKEINGSVNHNPPLYYQLTEIDVPKPNFSNLRFLQNDTKVNDDPRLRLMFRRSSTDDCANPTIPSQTNYQRTGSLEEPKMNEHIEKSRDPREKEIRDPRMSSNLNRMQRDPRSLSQESFEEMDHQSSDMYMGRMMQNFNNAAPVQGPYMQFDPRGRPGLLGPAPSNVRMPHTGPCLLTPPINPGPNLIPEGIVSGPQFWPNKPHVPFKDPRLNRDM